MGMWAVLLRNQTTGMLHAANREANASAMQLANLCIDISSTVMVK
jgi:hypothetical protein